MKPQKPTAFLYTSTCCNVQAKKDPCERSRTDLKEGKYSQASLGKWYCGACKGKCSVTRSRV